MSTLLEMLSNAKETNDSASTLEAQLRQLETTKTKSKLLGTFRFLSPLSLDTSPQFGFKVINQDTLDSRDYSDRMAAELFHALFNEAGELRDGVVLNERGNAEFSIKCELVLPKTEEQLETAAEAKTSKALSMFGS